MCGQPLCSVAVPFANTQSIHYVAATTYSSAHLAELVLYVPGKLWLTWNGRRSKGHSHEEGNDAADKLVGYAQAGQTRNEQDIARIMDALRATDD